MILSRQDLSNDENVRDCVHELREIMDHVLDQRDDMSISSYTSGWMKKWGEAIIAHLSDPPVDHHLLDEAYRETTLMEDKFKSLKNEIEDAITGLETCIDLPTSKISAEIEKIICDLEKAIS